MCVNIHILMYIWCLQTSNLRQLYDFFTPYSIIIKYIIIKDKSTYLFITQDIEPNCQLKPLVMGARKIVQT